MKTFNIINRNWTRRKLLSRFGSAGAVTAISPFIPLLEAGAAEAPIQRFFWWYTGQYDNSVAGYYHNNTSGDANFPNGSPFADALNPWSSKIALVQGIDNQGAPQSGGGGPHRRGAMTGMTGTKLVDKKGGDPDLFKGKTLAGDGNSLDQLIADKMVADGVKTAYRSLHVGWHFSSQHLGERSFSYKNKAPQAIEQNPAALFNKMYDLTGAKNNNSSGPNPKISVLNYALESVKSLQSRISVDDRAKLDKHLTSISELEQNLKAIDNGEFACPEIAELEMKGVKDRNGVPTGILQAGNHLDKLSESFFDLIGLAFACDITRVATFQFSRGTDDHVYTFLSDDVKKYPGDFHGYTHNRFGTQSKEIKQSNGISGVTDRIVTQAVKWRSGQFARLMEQLDGMPEGDGTALDNSCLLWWGDVSQAHDFHSMRWIYAGSAGGKLITGKRTHHNKTPINGLLNTVARAYGVDKDVGTYGKGVVFNNLLSS